MNISKASQLFTLTGARTLTLYRDTLEFRTGLEFGLKRHFMLGAGGDRAGGEGERNQRLRFPTTTMTPDDVPIEMLRVKTLNRRPAIDLGWQSGTRSCRRNEGYRIPSTAVPRRRAEYRKS